MNNPISVAFAVFSLLMMSYFGVYKFVAKDVSEQSHYQSAHLVYPAHTGTNMSKYAVLVDAKLGRFGFAETEGRNLNIKLYIAKSAHITLRAKAAYTEEKCTAAGLDKAVLRISSPHVLSNAVLLAATPVDHSFQAFQGDELSVTITNAANRGCGGAFVTLFEQNHVKHYPAIYLVFWCLLAMLFARLNLPIPLLMLGASTNLLWLLASKGTDINSLAQLVSTTLVSLMFCGAWLFVWGVITNRLFRTLFATAITLVVTILPILFLVHFIVFDAMPNIDTFHAILQSHKNQIIEFWFNILGLKAVFATVFVLIGLVVTVYFSSRFRFRRRPALIVGALMVAVGVRDFSVYLDASPLIQIPATAVGSYFHELQAFQRLHDSREQGGDQLVAQTLDTDTTLLVIIGESASKVHMSSYGYPRATTPNTDLLITNGEMIRFNAAYSNHTYSNPTISRALTAASNYNDKQWSGEPSIMNVLNAAGIRTTWVSNKLKFGPWDNVMSVIGDDAQRTIHINTKVGKNLISNRYDGALVPLVKQALYEANADNKVIFVHLQGSHVDYAARYPSSHRKYNKGLDEKTFGAAPHSPGFNASVVNTYDNSIYYTDNVIGQVIDLLKTEKGKVGLLYFSDHGENVFNRKSHNAALFTYDMAAIPMLFWANTHWQRVYAERWQALHSNINAVFTNDHIFDTVLGLTGTNSDYTLPENDLSSANYQQPTNPKTLHGTEALNTVKNRSYWYAKNLAALNANQSALIGSKVSSVGHATQFLSAGLGAMHLELALANEAPDSELTVVFSNALSMDIDTFLGALPSSQLGNLTVSLKRFDAPLSKLIAARLQALQERCNNELSVLVHPKNVDLLSSLNSDIKRGVSLREVDLNQHANSTELLSLIESLIASANADVSKFRVAVSANGYRRLKKALELSDLDGELQYIIDLSKNYSFQSQGFGDALASEQYWNQGDVDHILIEYESLFAQ